MIPLDVLTHRRLADSRGLIKTEVGPSGEMPLRALITTRSFLHHACDVIRYFGVKHLAF
jgi:hypothetical protein